MGRNHIHLFSADLLQEEPRGSHDTILFLVGAPRLPKIKITTGADAATNKNQSSHPEKSYASPVHMYIFAFFHRAHSASGVQARRVSYPTLS